MSDSPTSTSQNQQSYFHYEAICENKPYHGRTDLADEGHYQQLVSATGYKQDAVDALVEAITIDTCPECGGEITTETVDGKWPPENPTVDTIRDLFDQTRGRFVIEFSPSRSELDFYIGEIGGHYRVETEELTRPQADTSLDNLPTLVSTFPNKLRSVENTPLSGYYEDYQNGATID